MEIESLTPPAALTPPAPVAPVAQEQAAGMVPISAEEQQALDEKVRAFIDVVVSQAVHSDAFKEKLSLVHNMGHQEVRAAAQMSNRMLERPVASLNNGLMDERSPLSAQLVDLRRTVEDLDPSRQGDLLTPRRLFGLIPFGNRIRDFFLRYQSAQAHLATILQALYSGQDELRRDNATIEQEKVNLWAAMQTLEKYVYVGKQIDTSLTTRVAEIELSDAEKARVVKEEMLFYVRQKVQDLLTQLAVSVQGYLALDMIRKNNLELIKGVDRATTTTVSALRTAVMVAQALANQKLVLDQITALNRTTSDMIAGTAEMMRRQSNQIHQQAANATVDLDKLKAAFQNIYAAMDEMANYKMKALDSMQQTVTTLSSEVDKARTYLERTRRQEADAAVAGAPSVAAGQVLI